MGHRWVIGILRLWKFYISRPYSSASVYTAVYNLVHKCPNKFSMQGGHNDDDTVKHGKKKDAGG